MKGDGHDGAIVRTDSSHRVHLGPAESSKPRHYAPDFDAGLAKELAQNHFQIVVRFADEKQHD